MARLGRKSRKKGKKDTKTATREQMSFRIRRFAINLSPAIVNIVKILVFHRTDVSVSVYASVCVRVVEDGSSGSVATSFSSTKRGSDIAAACFGGRPIFTQHSPISVRIKR